jgi:ribonuclease G
LRSIRAIFGGPEPKPEPAPQPDPKPAPKQERRQEDEGASGGGRKRKNKRNKNKSKADDAVEGAEATGGGEPQQKQQEKAKPKEERKDNKRRGRRRDDDFDLSEIPKKFHVNTEVIVQVTKGAIGTKGPRVTTNLSIPGRYVVLLPNSSHRGVSRRIESRRERERLRKLVRQLELPKGVGLICRTAATDLDVEEVQRDVDMLVSKWQDAQMDIHDKPSPCSVYQEPDVLERTIRDFLSTDVDEIIVDTREACNLVQSYVEHLNAKDRTKVTYYQKARPIFQYYKIKKQIEQIFSRKVTLKSGAELCIDETEALIAIDINSGKSRGGKDHPETILRTNLEAAEAVARQLRLRNIGGLVVVDFIDMRSRKDQELVYNCMRKGLERDRAKTRMLRISRLGLMEMTRQREYESLRDAVFEDCDYCSGKGLVKSALSVSVEIQRRLLEVLRRRQGKDGIIRVTVHPSIAARVRKEDKALIEEMEEKYNGRLAFRSDARMHSETYRIVDSESGEEL